MIGENEFLQEKSNPEILEGLLDTLENNNCGEGIDGVIEALYTMLKHNLNVND